MDSILFFFFWIVFAGIAVSHIWNSSHKQKDSILPSVNEEFRALVVNSESPSLRFDGRTAEIVDEHQEHYTDRQSIASTLVSVQRFARNEYGEYFFFVSVGDGKPFLKHVSHTNARIALGKKYVEPTFPIDG